MADQKEQSFPPLWSSFDTLAICLLLIAALVAHLWRLGVPNVLVYDERIYVDQAFHYLRGEQYFEVHPPLPTLLIAGGLRLFGCHPWSWRISSAVTGSILVPVTYLLARRIFTSRSAGVFAAVLVLCDGMMLEQSRLALTNIVYITFGAASFLMLFRFMQSQNSRDRRWSLVYLGVLLGLGLGSKFAIPGITWLVAMGFLLFALVGEFFDRQAIERDDSVFKPGFGYVAGAVALVGGLSAFFFLLVFLPNYVLGWWTGVADLTSYHVSVIQANMRYPHLPTEQNSRWWTWPLLIRPYQYWSGKDDLGRMQVIWGGGNPAIWWGGLVAIALCLMRALRREGVAWSFLSIAYLMYLGMWVPVQRDVYLYSYMPALYVSILALGGWLATCWNDSARVWEHIAILLPVFAVCLFVLGYLFGGIISSSILLCYAALRRKSVWSSRFVCVIFVATAIAVFFYFLPMWITLPMSKSDFDARMWLNKFDLGDWM